MNQFDFAMAQLERDLDRLGLPIETVWAAPFALFVVLVILEKWRHRAPTDVMIRVQRQRMSEAQRGSGGHGVTVVIGCAVGLACVLLMDWLGVSLGW